MVSVECSFVLGGGQRFISCLVLEWIMAAASQITQPLQFHEGQINPREGTRVGWFALRQALRSWRFALREHLTAVGRESFQALLPGNTLVPGHRRRCSVEHVRESVFVAWFFMLGGSQVCQLEVLQQNLHHKTQFPFPRSGHSWTQSTYWRNC